MDYVMPDMKVIDIVSEFSRKKAQGEVNDDGTIEIIGAHFEADADTLLGSKNVDYQTAELKWYLTASLNVETIPYEPIPKIWKDIADKDGNINSNYGWCIFAGENAFQFRYCVNELLKNKNSRRATMIYTRPTMQIDAFCNGMTDFMCTWGVQVLIRGNELIYIVNMRSNDAVYGYNNDFFWHNFVQDMLLNELAKKYGELVKTNIIWNAGSLHVYERHHHLIP